MSATDDAKQRYDRQIRVWGKEAQHRLVNSRVLLCGMKHLNIEIAKNLVLAGVNICIQDSRAIDEFDAGSNFLLQPGASEASKIASAMLPGLSALNSHCRIEVEEREISELDDSFFAQYDLVCYCGNDEVSRSTSFALMIASAVADCAIRLNAVTRSRKPYAAMFWAMAFGDEALFFSDFGPAHEWVADVHPTKTSQPQEPSAHVVNSLSIHEAVSIPWKDTVSRLFPLSPTLVKGRLVCAARQQLQRELGHKDEDMLVTLYRSMAAQNGLSADEASTLINSSELHRLCAQTQVCSIVSCSVLGSVLAQEIIKTITHVGQPGIGVFVFSASNMVVRCIPLQKPSS